MGCNLSVSRRTASVIAVGHRLTQSQTAWLWRKRAPAVKSAAAKEAAENTRSPDQEPVFITAQKTAPTSRPLATVPEWDAKPPVQPASAHRRKKPVGFNVTSDQAPRSTYSPPSQSYHPTSAYVPTYIYLGGSGGDCGGGNSSSGDGGGCTSYGGDSSGGGCTSFGGDSSGGGGCSSC